MNLGTLVFDAFNNQQNQKLARQQAQQQLAQQQQQNQQQKQIQGILGGIVSGQSGGLTRNPVDLLTNGGINPLANSPGLNNIGSILGEIGSNQPQPQQSPLPQTPQPVTIENFDPFEAEEEAQQFEVSQAEQILQLTSLGASRDQVSAAVNLAGLRSKQVRDRAFAPVKTGIQSISQRLFQEDEEGAKRIARRLEKVNPKLAGFLEPDEDGFRDRVLLASNQLGLGQDIREGELEIAQKDRIDDNALINDLTLEGAKNQNDIAQERLRQQGTDRTARASVEVAQLNTGNNTSTAIKEQSKQDVKDLASAREAVASSFPIIQALSQARDVLSSDNFSTGSLSSLRGNFLRLGATLGVEGLVDAASDFEIINKVGKQLGIQTVSLLGGSDTERELAVAIETNVSADKTPKTNRRLLSEKIAAIDVIVQRPQFLEAWLSRHGSTLSTDEDGQNFSQAWRAEQKTLFELSKARDAIGRGAPSDAVIQLLQQEGIDPSRL